LTEHFKRLQLEVLVSSPSHHLLLWCGRKRERKENHRKLSSPTFSIEGMRMVRFFDCCNLIKSWKPTTKSDWLFEEKWKCKITDEQLAEYYLIPKERECKHYEKRPKLVL